MPLVLKIHKEPPNNNWSLERLAQEFPPPSWEGVFENAKDELAHISKILEEDKIKYGDYFPMNTEVFNAFNQTRLSEVKVVLVGQDPYHQSIVLNGKPISRAMGLSFSVRYGDSIPSSLNNIYQELANTVRGFKRPDHGNLISWCHAGVLLLNSCLTVRPNQAGSHGQIWLGFINKVLRAISNVNPNCIYLLWGKDAQKLREMIGEKSIILEAAHPSGLSANRGFFGCNHFNKVNEILLKQGKTTINWNIPSLAEINAQNSNAAANPNPNIGVPASLTPVKLNLLHQPKPEEVKEVTHSTPVTPVVPVIPVIPIPNIKLSLPVIPKLNL